MASGGGTIVEQLAYLTKGWLVRSGDDIFHCYQIVKSLPGFGTVASLLWTMLFYGKGRLDARKIASRFGFAPHAKVSGTSLHSPARSSRHGMSEVRKVLMLDARSAAAHDEKLQAYNEKKLAEGKPSKLITNNVINKLIRVVSTMWNEGTLYEPSHVSRFTKQSALST